MQPRTLGVDVGDRRIGVAMTDALGLAQPLLTMGRKALKQEMKDFGRIVRKHGVAAIVVGLPLNMDGSPSAQTAKAELFAQAMREHLDIPVSMQDERLSSVAAEELLDRRGVPRGPSRKAVLDQYAAVVILQDWIDAQARVR